MKLFPVTIGHAFTQFLVTACLVLFTTLALAQQAEEFEGYTVHYNTINTSQLNPAVAQAYGIKRSSSRALLNITVLDSSSEPARAVEATVGVRAKNLTGQRRDIEVRKIAEGDDAIYYIGEFRVNHMETFDFKVSVTPAGSKTPLELTFRQQFYTE